MLISKLCRKFLKSTKTSTKMTNKAMHSTERKLREQFQIKLTKSLKLSQPLITWSGRIPLGNYSFSVNTSLTIMGHSSSKLLNNVLIQSLNKKTIIKRWSKTNFSPKNLSQETKKRNLKMFLINAWPFFKMPGSLLKSMKEKKTMSTLKP